jgi:hypothetical protein
MLDRYIDNLVDLSPGEEHEPVVIGPLRLDLHRRVVTKNGEGDAPVAEGICGAGGAG